MILEALGPLIFSRNDLTSLGTRVRPYHPQSKGADSAEALSFCLPLSVHLHRSVSWQLPQSQEGSWPYNMSLGFFFFSQVTERSNRQTHGE